MENMDSVQVMSEETFSRNLAVEVGVTTVSVYVLFSVSHAAKLYTLVRTFGKCDNIFFLSKACVYAYM